MPPRVSTCISKILLLMLIMFLLPGCGGGGSSLESFPGSNVNRDGTINWEQAFSSTREKGDQGGIFSLRALDYEVTCSGGSGADGANCVQPTSDGGYIVAGYSSSADGDCLNSGNHGGGDAWIIKYSPSGTVMWQKCYGGSEWDCAKGITQTSNGDYIFAGITRSHDGDVQSRKDKTATDDDIWVVKLNAEGALQWEQFFGNSGTDGARSVCATSDGGCAVAGVLDYSAYILKLDSTGSQTWAHTVSGGDNRANSIIQTADGFYMCAGYVSSGSDETEGNHGSYDAWLMKLDENGTYLWHKCFGGSSSDDAYSLQQTSDNGYIVAGHTRSSDGDLTGKNANGNDCGWFVKLDSTGSVIEWQTCIENGIYGCWGREARVTSDGYIVTGFAYYSGRIDNGIVAKLDSTGTLSWLMAPGGTGEDYSYSVCEVSGNYITAGETYSFSSNHGGSDAFIVTVTGGTTPSPSPSPSVQLTIENAKAEPGEFTPPDQTTTISATVTAAGFTPTNPQWDVVIKDMYDTDVRTFPTGTGLDVSAQWDGMKDDGTFAGYGNYTFKITAKCDECEALPVTGTLSVTPPIPTLTKLVFENAIRFDSYSNIYYGVENDKTLQNPIVIALARMNRKNQESSEGLCNLTLKVSQGPIEPVTYEIRLNASNKFTLIENVYATFDKHERVKVRDACFKVPNNVTTLKDVDISYRFGKIVNSHFQPVGQWVDDKIAKPEKSIWVALDEPKRPLRIHGTEDTTLAPHHMELACPLAEGAKNEEEVRTTIMRNISTFLKDNNFIYAPQITHFQKILPRGGGNFDFFGFTFFLFYPDMGSSFVGDCADISAFQSVCCAAVGVEMNLAMFEANAGSPFTTYKIVSRGAQEYDVTTDILRSPQWHNWELVLHQVCSFNDYIYDPTFQFQTMEMSGAENPVTWPDGLAIKILRDEFKELVVKSSNSPVQWFEKPREYHIEHLRLNF